MNKIKKKLIIFAVIVISLVGIIYFGFAKNDNSSELEYETEKVIRGDIQSAISVDGKILFDTWNLEFLNAGTVEDILVDLGDTVKKDQILARSDSSLEDNKIIQSKAELNSSVLSAERLSEEGVDYKIKKKAYSAAKDRLEAEEGLYDEYVNSNGKDSSQALSQKVKVRSAEANVENAKKQLEQVEESYQNAKYQLNKSQASYNSAKDAYDNYEIISPVDNAIVAQINGTIGSVVGGDKASLAEPFVVLVDPDSFWFEAYVEDMEALKIESGMKAYIELEAYADQKFEGRVVFVSPVAEIDSNDLASYKVIVSINDTDLKFLSDMAGSVNFVSSEVKDVLMISNDAVRNKNGKQTVIVKKEDNFEEREIEVGFTNRKKVEIKSGLKLGAEVIVAK